MGRCLEVKRTSGFGGKELTERGSEVMNDAASSFFPFLSRFLTVTN
jgi:hypothetical protein